MTLAEQILIAVIGVCIVGALMIAVWLYDAPELAPDDEDGLSDREREELRIIRDHEKGPWE